MNIFMLIDPEWIIHEIHRPSVQKGAVWLDEYEPTWSEQIVPKHLDLLSTDVCICGQLFGAFSERPSFVHEAKDFGFTDMAFEVHNLFDEAWFENSDLQSMSFKALDHLWLDEIFWRRCEELDLFDSYHTSHYRCQH